MQPQFRQTPPGRSSSMAATVRPSWAHRIAATYPPGPVPTTTTSYFTVAMTPRSCEEAQRLPEQPRPGHVRRHSGSSRSPARSCEEAQRLFEQPLHVLKEPRAHRPVHHAVIARDRHLHAPPDADLAVVDHRLLDDRA